MLPNHIQTCLILLVKFWRLAVLAGKISRQGHNVTAFSDSGVQLHFKRRSSGRISMSSNSSHG